MSKPVFGYWELRELGHPAKLALYYLEVDFVDKRYALSAECFAEWTQKEKFTLGLDFPNLPYWKDGERNVTESRAILKCIAREKGGGILMPTDPQLLSAAEMVENVLWDTWWYLIRRCFNDTEEHINTLNKSAPPKLEQLNKFLGNKKWILGEKISYVDFMLYEMLYTYSAYDQKFIEPYIGLVKLRENFEKLPTIQRHIASPQYIKGPCVNPFSKYKI